MGTSVKGQVLEILRTLLHVASSNGVNHKRLNYSLQKIKSIC